jgi:hypothetical protein
LLILVCWGVGRLHCLTLSLLVASLFEGTPSVSSAPSGSKHVGKLIEEATNGEEEDRQHTKKCEDGERYGRVQRFRYLSDQVTEPRLSRRAFVSSATVKWLEPRCPTLDATLGVSVAEVGALGFPLGTAGRTESRTFKRLCEPASIGRDAQVKVCTLPRSRAVGTPYTMQM